MTEFTDEQLKLLKEKIEFTEYGFNIVGDVPGHVKGNVWFNVSGSVWHNVEGSVGGDVWGSVGGSVREYIGHGWVRKETSND